jgi:hypothetical protein
LTKLEGDSYELGRQLGEISRLEDFVKYQQSGGDTTAFLFNWSRHQTMRNELNKSSYSLMEHEVGLDVKAAGEIKIVSNDPVPLPKRPNTPGGRNVSRHQTPSPSKQVMSVSLVLMIIHVDYLL